MLNVSDNNVYKAQTCTVFYYNTQEDGTVEVLRTEDRVYLIKRVFSKQNTFLC